MAMSDEHKAALAQGRAEARAIKAYLAATGSRKRGRPVTPQSLAKRTVDLERRIEAEVNPLRAVDLRQARLDAEAQLAQIQDAADVTQLEAGFVQHAAAYSQRKGISYAAWREAGVTAAVLRQAGIGRAG